MPLVKTEAREVVPMSAADAEGTAKAARGKARVAQAIPPIRRE
jgi:hypothetical protein